MRALRPLGVSVSIAIQEISIMGFSYDAKAKRARFDLRRLQFKLFEKLRLGSYPRRSHRVSAGARCPSGCQPFWQFAVPGIAEVSLRRASPAALILLLSFAAVRYRRLLPTSRVVMQKNLPLINSRSLHPF